MNFKKTMGLTAAISALGASGIANADIELGEGLTVTGFIDMSGGYTEVDGASDSDPVFAIDQVETNFLYTGSNGISAQVDIEYGESGNDSDGDITTEEDATFVEQAFITKQLGDNFSIKGGRFLSYTGWETEEPTGLYQYSSAGYGDLFYGGYQQGISGMYDGDSVDFMVSFVNDAFDPVTNDRASIEVEVGVAFQPMEGMTTKLFYIDDSENDTEIVNFWTSFETGDWTFAFEYNIGEYAADAEADGYLLMANYSIGSWGYTFRYHDYSLENGAGVTTRENSAITFAPSYVVSDNLLLVAEVRIDDNGDTGADSDTVVLEALFTF